MAWFGRLLLCTCGGWGGVGVLGVMRAIHSPLSTVVSLSLFLSFSLTWKLHLQDKASVLREGFVWEQKEQDQRVLAKKKHYCVLNGWAQVELHRLQKSAFFAGPKSTFQKNSIEISPPFFGRVAVAHLSPARTLSPSSISISLFACASVCTYSLYLTHVAS
jgi:hypothetical protein